MDPTLLHQFNQVVNREKARINKKLTVFLFFFAVSIILWFLIKLSHEYTTAINFPVQLVNPPKGKIVAGVPPRTIQCKVKAYGYTLLRYKLFALMGPLRINLKSVQKQKGSDSEYFILTGDKFESFISQLNQDVVLLNVQPDTLFFSMTSVVDKVVPVKPELNVTFANQFMQSGTIKVSPENITVTGPKSVVDTVSEVKTKPLTLNMLAERTKVKVPLLPIPQLTYSYNDISVEIPVEKFTEITLEVPIVPRNIPENLEAILLPEKVTLKCNIIISKYFSLKPNYFRAICDFSDTDAIANGRVRVTIDEYPSYVGRIDYQPKFVDFIIKQK
ncbi:MAG: CdaR family protein [Bacteroidales bacterium]